MRKIDPNRYEPLYSSKTKSPKPDDIDVSGIVPLKPRTKKLKQGKQTSKKKSTHVHKKTSTQKTKPKKANVSKPEYVQAFLDLKPSTTSTFRVPQAIIDKFDETFYQIKGTHKTKINKYSLVVTALSLLIWDYEQHGKQSDLYKLLIEDTQKSSR